MKILFTVCERIFFSILLLRESAGQFVCREAWWPSGRASDSGARGRGFDPHSLCCVLEQDTFTSQKVLVIPRKPWLHPDMTEKLLIGTLNLIKTKTKICMSLTV